MGLSIHYSGYISNLKFIKTLTEEVIDICTDLGWDFKTINNFEIDGIAFWPEKSEPIFLTFNKDGRLLSPVNILAKDIFDGERVEKELIFTTSTKTQYAGIEAHIATIKLLRHLSKKYMQDFMLVDEGLYWETNDEKILQDSFKRYIEIIAIFCEALKEVSSVPGESAESLGDRIEKLLRNKFRGKKDYKLKENIFLKNIKICFY